MAQSGTDLPINVNEGYLIWAGVGHKLFSTVKPNLKMGQISGLDGQ
jgi:hypothetical protein